MGHPADHAGATLHHAHRATRGVPADFLDPQGSQLNHLYLIVNAVEELEPGAYVLHRGRRVLECLKSGDFRDQAGYLGLQQALPADAAAAVFFLADLRPILQRYGNRGYRDLQLEAGIIGGKLYLAAYAQRLGTTGLTFLTTTLLRSSPLTQKARARSSWRPWATARRS